MGMNHAPTPYDCPFCRLVRADLPQNSVNVAADIVWQTETVTAFVSPAWWQNNPGHVIVIPNRHFENLYELPAAENAAVAEATRRVVIAIKTAYQCPGVSTRQHNEPSGNQDVWHYHQHIFPRYTNDDLYGSNTKRWTTPDERLPYANRLREALSADSEESKPIVVIFRSRLRPEHAAEYGETASEMANLARAQPGIIAFKTFTASDGERVTIAEFESLKAVDAWRENARHKEAQAAGRDRFYSEYRLQVCVSARDYGFEK